MSPGIFCLEGDWETDLRRTYSVEPVLTLLRDLGIASYIHRNTATRDQLEYYLAKWGQKRYDNYTTLYLAFHGDVGNLALGRDTVDLETLATLLEGRCRGANVHFASCLTLDVDDDTLTAFVRRIGAKAVTGYRDEVEWLDSAAFEALMLERLTRGSRTDAFYRGLHKDHGTLATRLGLVAATPRAVYRSPH